MLVVDDTPVNLEVMVELLRLGGYRAVTALSGPDAIEKAQTEQPDLILLDVLMPTMDGHEACRRLKEHQVTRDIPVIFLSGLTETQDQAAGLDAGAVDYIAKPFMAKEVLARVGKHVTRRRGRQPLSQANGSPA